MSRAARIFVVLASPLMLVGFALPEPLGPAVFGVLAAGLPVALMALGGARRGRLGPLALPLAILLLLLVGGTLGLLALRGTVLSAPWVGGLPAAAAILVYGIGLLPLPLVALAYALTFDRFILPEEELRRLREALTARNEPR